MQLPSYLQILLCFLIISSVSATEIPDSLMTSSNAIVLLEKYKVRFEKYNKYTLEYEKSTKILNKKAKHLQKLYFEFKEGSEKLSDIQISVFDSEGVLLQKAKSKDVEEYASGDGNSIVTDQRIKFWSYNTNAYPITITYSYKKESKNTLLLPVWSPVPSRDVAVLEANYLITTDQALRIKELNLGSFPTIEKIGQSYSIKNQKSLNKESYSPSNYEVVPIVIICPKKFSYEGIDGEFDNWSEYGKWMYNSFLRNKELPSVEDIKSELSSLIQPTDSDKEIIRKVYDFVQQNTRYVSISLDEGGFNPMDPAKVHQVKYGDCKALSLYTKTILDSYGISANYTEVYASSNKVPQGLFTDFACALPGNHIILNVPLEKDTVWLDCTSHSNPYNFLGSFTDNRQAISIEENGGKLVQTPIYKQSQNSHQDTITLLINSEGDATVNITTKSSHLSTQDDLRLFYKSQKEKEKHFEEDVFDNLNNLKMTKVSITLDEEKIESYKELDFQIDTYAETSGNYIFIPKSITSLSIPKLKKDKKRINPIYFPRGYTQSSTIIIKHENQLKLVEDSTLSIDSEYGNFSCSFSQSKNGHHTITRAFSLNAGVHPAEEYNKIKSFFDEALKSEQSPITFVKS